VFSHDGDDQVSECMSCLTCSQVATRRANVNAHRPGVVAAAAAVLPAVSRKNAAREKLISSILNGRRMPDLAQLQKSINLYKVKRVWVTLRCQPVQTGSVLFTLNFSFN